MTSLPTVIIYREELLGGSETFILGQGESLSRFEPFYLGLRRRPGLELPKERVHIVSGSGFKGKLQRLRFKLLGPGPALRSMLAAKSPLLVHAHFATDGCNAITLSRALRVPLVVTLHGYDVTIADALLPRLYVRRRNLLKTHAARFICVSEFIRKQALAQGFPADKLLVHYTGIDLNTFRPRPTAARSPIVLFVGRLVAKKGCDHLIRAMAHVQQVMPEAELVIIGDGPLREKLEAQAAASLKNHRFLGAQKPTVVRDWMNRAIVFSTPSVVAKSGDAEGFGMIFAEAHAMGLPVVSFASGGIPEAVAHEETGFLVEPGDDRALAAKLLLLLSRRDLRMQMSDAGKARAARLFDIWKQAAHLQDIYATVLTEWNAKAGIHPSSANAPSQRLNGTAIVPCPEGSAEVLAGSRSK